MAKFTNVVNVTDEWTELASGLDSVQLELLDTQPVYVAVAALIADLGTSDQGHLLRASRPDRTFPTGLLAKKVFGRCVTADATARVAVTGYDVA
jgi:hypothetical protein